MNDTVLQVQGLRKKYPAFTLSEVSFSLEAGRIMGFIGRNGAGKTTTLKSILGLVHPDAGEIRYFGLPFAQNEQRIKEQIGYAAGGTSYYQRRRVGEIARMTASFYPGWDDAAYRNYLRRFSLDESKCLRELSEGMKVKFLLTLALFTMPSCCFWMSPPAGRTPFPARSCWKFSCGWRRRAWLSCFPPTSPPTWKNAPMISPTSKREKFWPLGPSGNFSRATG